MSSDVVATDPSESAPLEVDEVILTGAIEQARWRLGQLHASFSSTMVILADMHQDEDWRYLTDASGAPYQSFTAMLSAELEISDSWARRQQQGLVDIVLPLRQLTHPDTRIPVSGGDVAALGKRGAEYVREHAPQVLSGIAEPRAQEKAIRALLDDTRARITGDHGAPDRQGHVITAGNDDPPEHRSERDLPPRIVDDSALVWDSPDEGDTEGDGVEPISAGGEQPDGEGASAPSQGSSRYGAASERGGSAAESPPSGGQSRYGATRAAADPLPGQDGDDTDDEHGSDEEESDEVVVAVASLAGVGDGDEAWNASLRVLATAPVPQEPDVDLETVTAAMLRINQLRSQLMAKNRPPR